MLGGTPAQRGLRRALTIVCVGPAQAQSTAQLSAWNPYASNDPQPSPTGTCTATFEVGTTVTFTATPDTGSFIDDGPTPNPVTIRTGYNYTWVMFCPNDGLCSAG
ncbi:hypothetical protein [Streptomyces deccanensis]|uniref:hypothetical protein n=1 Tax=Streptomyces deccanensis TaxID=424188 RepID=UPI001EFB3ED2|nr:hypothetical protein [Streptomyces deccanensis]ULR51021.1 hypothetical protein L3078_17905 [Streptomyces deccanensis]